MKRDKQELQAQFNRRALMMGGVGAAAFGVLGLRLYSLQVLEQDRYRTLSDDNQFNFRLQPPIRGRLLDRFDEPLADNRDSYRLFIVRDQVSDPRAALERLSEFMSLSEPRIERILRQMALSSRFQPVTIAEDLDWETFTRINLHLPELSGITPDLGQVRTYPHPQALAHITGYVQAAPPEIARGDPLLLHPGFRIGRAGVEAYAEDTLRGDAGQLKVEVNAYGRVIRELPDQSVPSQAGEDVRLSVDLNIQRVALEALDGQAASAVAMDVETGEILTLVSSPSFDPNSFVLGIGQEEFSALNTNPYRPLFNKATTGLYAPASTVKAMVALAALQEGVFDPDEEIRCTGSTPLGDRTFHCWKREGHGPVNMHEAVKTSCDIYFYEAARRLGIERWRNMALACGLGERHDIGIRIPNRADGLVPSPAWKRSRRGQPWTTGDTYNVGIGQGDLLASPLQLAVMTARVATGIRVQPTLRLRDEEPQFESMGFNEDYRELVHQAMRAAVHEVGGTSYWSLDAGGGLNIPGVEMCGKTGTAQVYSITAEERAAGVREQDDLPWRLRDHGLFVGYAPADKPKYVVSVVVEHGGGGSRAAAKPARDILKALVERDPVARSANRTAQAPAPSDTGES
jgi:penicillin-binding protein 2